MFFHNRSCEGVDLTNWPWITYFSPQRTHPVFLIKNLGNLVYPWYLFQLDCKCTYVIKKKLCTEVKGMENLTAAQSANSFTSEHTLGYHESGFQKGSKAEMVSITWAGPMRAPHWSIFKLLTMIPVVGKSFGPNCVLLAIVHAEERNAFITLSCPRWVRWMNTTPDTRITCRCSHVLCFSRIQFSDHCKSKTRVSRLISALGRHVACWRYPIPRTKVLFHWFRKFNSRRMTHSLVPFSVGGFELSL